MTLTKIASTGVEDSLRWVLGANGTSDYTFTGPGLTGTVNDPTIYLTRGQTYIFQNNSGGHPFYIKTSIANGGTNDAYNTGVTNNGGGNGTEIVFTVPHDSPDILYYQCSSHASMAGQFNIAGSVADGSISTAKLADDAVNNDKLANSVVAAIAANTAKTTNATHTGDVTGSTSLTIANNAVTNGKIVDGAVTTSKIADSTGIGNGVTTAKIADGAITSAKIAGSAVTLDKLPAGNGSNNGKFLRANNNASPSFESIPSGTTINNQADHRLITCTGTTDTLNGESTLIFDNSNNILVSGSGYAVANIGGHISGSGGGQDHISIKDSGGTERLVVKTHGTDIGNIGIGSSSPESKVAIKGTSGQADLFSISDTTVPTSGSEYGVAMIKTNSQHAALNITNYNTYGDGVRIYNNGGAVGRDALVCAQANGTRLVVNEDVTVSTGNLVIGTAGKGIDFSATSNSGTSELLDDYEEGTWTPFVMYYYNGAWYATTMTSNGTKRATYTKIGDMVYFDLDWHSWEVQNANYALISGLPYTCTEQGAFGMCYTNCFQNNQNQSGMISTNSTYIEFYRDNNSWNAIKNNSSNMYIYGAGVYKAS
jgi:hypothetical protein